MSDLALSQLDAAQQLALLRLMRYVTAQVQTDLAALTAPTVAMLRQAPPEQPLPPHLAVRAQSQLLRAWSGYTTTMAELIGRGVREAASLPFGAWAVMHNAYLPPELVEAPRPLAEGVESGVISSLLNRAVKATVQRTYSDGANLSARIWRLDQSARALMRRTFTEAVAFDHSPAWAAERVQIVMGAGLQREQGIAYQALRLARTEMSAALDQGQVLVYSQLPWIKAEQIHLAPEHPEPDECDTVVAGGEGGKGIYPVGTIQLPLHPNCYCWRSAVLADRREFAGHVGRWLSGRESWGEMDRYRALLGGSLAGFAGGATVGALTGWLQDKPASLAQRFWRR